MDWPAAKLAIGPTIEHGFYYDVDLDYKITPDDLPKIEADEQLLRQALFNLLDSDADEKLSREEARRAISRVPKLKDNPEVLERLFDKVDSDKDDKLNIDEYEQLRELLGSRR